MFKAIYAVWNFICLQVNGFNAWISMMVYGKLVTIIRLAIINALMARNGSTLTGSNMTGLQTIRGSQVLRLMASGRHQLVPDSKMINSILLIHQTQASVFV